MRFKHAVFIAFAAFAVAALLGCGSGGRTPDIPPHLISTPSPDPVRPITEREQKQIKSVPQNADAAAWREHVDELYATVVYDGMQPVFSENDPLQAVYANALAVLDRYILDSWHDGADGEYNIVHAVHDYLVCNIDYDFELFDSFGAGDENTQYDPAFHIDGVFSGGRAVCDGLSRAFDFLCAIEGVKSCRITGSLSGSPHAWNKVNIGGEWFNVDVTADAAYYKRRDGSYKKQLSHGFFLVGDKTLAEFKSNPHVFERQPYEAKRDYDYYSQADDPLVIGGKTYSRCVTTAAELNAIFRAAGNSDRSVGKFELKLSFDGKTQVNEADMYATEIAAAYRLCKSDYDTSVKFPYFSYPNGVYLFLIYN